MTRPTIYSPRPAEDAVGRNNTNTTIYNIHICVGCRKQVGEGTVWKEIERSESLVGTVGLGAILLFLKRPRPHSIARYLQLSTTFTLSIDVQKFLVLLEVSAGSCLDPKVLLTVVKPSAVVNETNGL